MPGAVTRSDTLPPGIQTVAGSILTSGKTFFRCDMVMKKTSAAILYLQLIQEGQLSVTGEVLINCLGGLSRNSVDRLADCARNGLKCVEGP